MSELLSQLEAEVGRPTADQLANFVRMWHSLGVQKLESESATCVNWPTGLHWDEARALEYFAAAAAAAAEVQIDEYPYG